MVFSHRGRRAIFGFLGAMPIMIAATLWMSRSPLPGAEGGRGPLAARSLYAQAAAESQAGDRAGTLRHLRMAVAVIEGHAATADDRAVEFRVRTSLARVLLARGERAEAVAVCAPACRLHPGGTALDELSAQGLCPP